MTVNIGLVTSDAVILGCDSIASVTGYYVDPFSLDLRLDEKGRPVVDENKRFTAQVGIQDWKPLITNTWGGVTKLFLIHPSPTPVAAVTTGLAKLNDRSIASLATEFRSGFDKPAKKLTSVEAICKKFLEFMRVQYEKQYKESNLPEEFQEGPEFIAGGIAKNDEFPCTFRIRVKENTCVRCFNKRVPTGLSWGGQSDAVERFVRGFDGELRRAIEKQITGKITTYSGSVKAFVADKINEILGKLGQQMPEGVALDVPELSEIKLEWGSFRTELDYANIPLQEGVNFVSFLVGLQSGKSRFAQGIATVGGRTHVGVITKEDGFRFINEPVLQHRYTGFGDDQ